MPALEAASDGISAPWVSASPDWPWNVGLRVVFRALLAVAFLRALRRPRDELSMIVLAHSAAALAATVLGGNRGVPNGYRFGYLSDMTAIAIAGGALWTLLLVRRPGRPVLATALTGLLAATSLLGVRDFFRYFWILPGRERSSETTLVARAALRWDRYGTVEIDPRLVHFKVMVAAIRRYRLDPENPGSPAGASPACRDRPKVSDRPAGHRPASRRARRRGREGRRLDLCRRPREKRTSAAGRTPRRRVGSMTLLEPASVSVAGRKRRKARGWLLAAAGAAATAGLWIVSRGKWSDAIIDSGREWIVPDALSRGELLYRDVVYWFGPFTPYFQAAFFRAFGSGFGTLVLSGAVASCGTIAALFLAARRVTGRAEAAWAAALAVPVFVFMPNAGGPLLGMGYRIWQAATFGLLAIAVACRRPHLRGTAAPSAWRRPGPLPGWPASAERNGVSSR